MVAASSAPASPPAPDAQRGESVKEVLRPVLGFLANATVVTALLVYFGWRRAETHAARLGIDESVLGMSTREYVLRSVGPVLVLLVGVGAGGLAWLSLGPRLTAWLGATRRTGAARATVLLLSASWLLLPALVYLAGFVWRAPAHVLFPASIGVGVLLLSYAHARAWAPDGGGRREPWSLAFTGVLVLVALFWTASNYAEVLGRRLADDLAGGVGRLPGVVVHSEHRLHLQGPGVREAVLPGDEAGPVYRYAGLRLLEHAGGRYFLVSDGWTMQRGVVFTLREDDEGLRFDFVRGLQPDGGEPVG